MSHVREPNMCIHVSSMHDLKFLKVGPACCFVHIAIRVFHLTLYSVFQFISLKILFYFFISRLCFLIQRFYRSISLLFYFILYLTYIMWRKLYITLGCIWTESILLKFNLLKIESSFEFYYPSQASRPRPLVNFILFPCSYYSFCDYIHLSIEFWNLDNYLILVKYNIMLYNIYTKSCVDKYIIYDGNKINTDRDAKLEPISCNSLECICFINFQLIQQQLTIDS